MATTIRLTNLAAYRDYFSAIATSHVDIAGFKWGEKEVVMNDNRHATPNFLWAMPYDRVRYTDRSSDNVHKIKTARVAYMCVAASDKFEDEDAAFEASELIIEEILAKILVDKRGAEVAGDWQMIITDIASWSTGPIEKAIGSTKYIGWELSINFQDPTSLLYNASKWE
ncbi:MAG TPA: hypothetical protein VK658_23190 [Chryseolinea sp.]|nr:hypothetical protein [Chryseolinea sp.]